jgi:thermolysin
VSVGEAAFDAGESSASAIAALRAATATLEARITAGQLRRVAVESDPLVVGRIHERFAQFYRGVPVFGADATRQLNNFGQTTSIFSAYFSDIGIDVTATLTADQARALAGLANGAGALSDPPTLEVLPIQGGYRLAWDSLVGAADGLEHRTFIDATTGVTLLTYLDSWTQAAVGQGTGLVGDQLTMHTSHGTTGPFQAVDLTRPGTLSTYDLAGDLPTSTAIASGRLSASASAIATSQTNTWTGEVASAHAYAGLTLDYLRRQFNRAGLDNRDGPVRLFVNVARPGDASPAPATLAAFYDGGLLGNDSDIFLGAGSLSPGGNVRNRPFAAGIDVVAHELVHGVTRFSSNLLYQFESGALNEAFSDILGAGAEFASQPLGSGPAQADWLFGEDVGVDSALRSFVDPHALGAPDHYSLKRIATLDADNGAVHSNASIVDHVFYLAVMGGTNRVSGLTVRGVGFSRHADVERVFYRAFTELLPRRATFETARAATLQAARDLSGVGSDLERAVEDAWAAVGVS